MEPSRIRQVIFKMDQQSNLKFDVNQTIKICDLKKMLETALQIPRSNIKLFHNNVLYSDKDHSRLEVLFPSLQSIEFYTEIVSGKEISQKENEIALRLKLGEYCESHVYKYPCFFCFDCNKSFCSICNLENIHLDHETIEKYDYLQNSEAIVKRIFAKSAEEIKKINKDNLEQAKSLERYITNDLFKFLKDRIKQVEDRLMDMLKVYTESHEISYFQINENLKEVIKTCVDALEKRKEELNLSEMLVDENVIINYYNSILQIHKQREHFLNDKSKIEELEKTIFKIKPLADRVFSELNSFLEGKLNNEAFSTCEKEIKQYKVSPVQKNIFMTQLIKEIKGSTNKKPSATKQGFNKSCGKFMSCEKKKFHHLDCTLEEENSKFINESPRMEKKISFNSNLETNLQNYIAAEAVQNFQTGSKGKLNKEEISNSLETPGNSIWEKKDNENFVYSIEPGKNGIYIYSEDRQRVKKFLINFPTLKSEKFFLLDCSWINAHGKLFISGGTSSDFRTSKEFLCYDSVDNSVKILKDLNEPKAQHSMVINDKKIYICGGQKAKLTEIYDIENNSIIAKENINYISVDNPVLFVYENFLYSFNGQKNGKFLDLLQRADLRSENNLKWEKISVKNPEGLKTNFIGFGVISYGTQDIYFFGGKSENGITNQSIKFNFEEMCYNDAEVPLHQGQWFKDTNFIELGLSTFGQFSLTDYDNFLKVNVQFA